MSAAVPERSVYGMAPLIRFTLLALYGALVLPLPLLAPAGLGAFLWGAVALGWVLVVAITSEQVILNQDGLRVGHPAWCGWWLKRGWQLPWSRVEGLSAVATSQGGRVFYVRSSGGSASGEGGARQAFLLPQRVERFEEFLSAFTARSGVSTASVARITPPWTYQLLALMSVARLVGEGVTLARMGFRLP